MTDDAAAKVIFVPVGKDAEGVGKSNSLGLTEVSILARTRPTLILRVPEV